MGHFLSGGSQTSVQISQDAAAIIVFFQKVQGLKRFRVPLLA